MKSKNLILKLMAIPSIVILVLLDQWTKVLARTNLIDAPFVLIDGVLEFHYVENRGAVWGLAQGSVIILAVVSIIIFLLVLYTYLKLPVTKHYLPISILSVFIMAGAIGNLIDRFVMNYVTDFIYFKLIDFPVFNVADIYITVSAIVVILLGFTIYRDDEWQFLSLRKKA